MAIWGSHWITSNNYGIYEDTKNELLLKVGADYTKKFGKKWVVETGVDFIIKDNLDQSFLYQGYANLPCGSLKFIVGVQELVIGQYAGELSTGAFGISNNARPIPQIGIGIYEYVDISLTNRIPADKRCHSSWMEKGHQVHSIADKPLLHEKFIYLRTQKIPVNFHVGFVHQAMYGGVDRQGNPSRWKIRNPLRHFPQL